MATFTRREESFVREVWAVGTPTNAAEVAKAMNAAASRAFVDQGGDKVHDDAITVESDECEIRFVITRRVPPQATEGS